MIPKTRLELEETYKDLAMNEAIIQIPGDIAYQTECIAQLTATVDRAKSAQKKAGITAFLMSPGGVKEREMKQKQEENSEDENVIEATFQLKLAETGYEYLNNLFIAYRKQISLEEQTKNPNKYA